MSRKTLKSYTAQNDFSDYSSTTHHNNTIMIHDLRRNEYIQHPVINAFQPILLLYKVPYYSHNKQVHYSPYVYFVIIKLITYISN